MNIRFGTYTVYRNIEMSITEYYGHGLDQEIEQNHRIISYPEELGMIDGFSFDSISKNFKRDILIDDLENAFYIITKAIYRGQEFNVWVYHEDRKKLTIYTFNEDLGQKFQFIKLSDRSIKEVGINEIEKIWEERSPSSYNLPMPDGLELVKEIKIPKN